MVKRIGSIYRQGERFSTRQGDDKRLMTRGVAWRVNDFQNAVSIQIKTVIGISCQKLPFETFAMKIFPTVGPGGKPVR